MTRIEYIWVDGYTPEPNLRSKIKVVKEVIYKLEDIPEWNFDGSSTLQAEGNNSDCILKPVRVYWSGVDTSKIYVLCEVMNPDGTPHETNQRAKLGDEDVDMWFGFEQEYFIQKEFGGMILGHDRIFVEPQGKYYCGVGSNVVGRDIVEEHMDLCLKMGIGITGVNAEVALGQWEYQVFSKGKIKAGDDLWISRYFMEKLSEKYGYDITLHPKPIQHSEWNGSGLHTNFSTDKMRNEGGVKYFTALFNSLESRRRQHIEVYGSDNELRLTGKYETQSIDKFSWGISDRGASIRVPVSTAKEWKGSIEDRRPASNANPYEIVKVICETINMADELAETVHNMYTNVSMKNFDEVAKKYNGILTSDELLREYQNDEQYELTSEMMESRANSKTEEVKFNINEK